MKVALVIVTLLPFIWGTDAAYKRVCYYTNWAQYRNSPAKYFPENVDPHLCTHVIYAFANLQDNELKPFEWNDESTSWQKGMYERFDGLKKINPALKTLLAVGGWTMGSAKFTAMVNSASSRRHFVTTTIEFLRQRNFDGLDMDWEYPGSRGSPSGDKQLFVVLLKELYDAFVEEGARTRTPRLLLTAAVPAGKDKIDAGYDIPAISRYLDFMNLMSYDLHGSWEDYTGHNSPLYRRSDETGDDAYLNLDWSAQYWVSKGAPRDKLIIGMPTYGHSYTLSDLSAILPGRGKASKGRAGTYTKEAGFLAYYEICQMLETGGIRYWDNEQMVPYVVKGNQWVGYDDSLSLQIKVDYVKKNNFGGVMIWATTLDDFNGMCQGGKKYPLLTAINRALGGSTPVVVPTTQAPEIITRTPTPHAITKAPTWWPTPAPSTHSPPTSSFTCAGKAMGFYTDSRSCATFYMCASSLMFSMICESGQLFDDVRKRCLNAHQVTCHDRPINYNIITSTPIPPVPTQPVVDNSHTKGTAQFCDNKANGIYKDPANCRFFYQCAGQLTFHESCPPGTVWDDNVIACNFRYLVPRC